MGCRVQGVGCREQDVWLRGDWTASASHAKPPPPVDPELYRGTSLIRDRTTLGPYISPMPRASWWSWGGRAVSYEWCTPVDPELTLWACGISIAERRPLYCTNTKHNSAGFTPEHAGLQGYLAHKEQHPPLAPGVVLLQGPRGRGAVPYEQGTPAIRCRAKSANIS